MVYFTKSLTLNKNVLLRFRHLISIGVYLRLLYDQIVV